ncbi:unnamed protein product [Sphagnum balticum]
MQAIQKSGSTVSVDEVLMPKLKRHDDVRVRVELAGLCRTDLYAAEGKLKTPDQLILGHEFSGVVTESSSMDFRSGDRVCVNPLLTCGHCACCLQGAHGACDEAQFIGVDKQGCFAGYIVVPASSIYRLPDSMRFLEAAYAEPVAASLAVLKTGITAEQKGVIYGANRFAQLLQQIMRVYGFNRVDLFDPTTKSANEQLETNGYDYAIETFINSQVMSDLIRVVKPGGKIILKSRQHEELSLKMNEIIKKEPILHVVNYGSFAEAIELLASGKLDITNLVDDIYSLQQFAPVFSRSKQSESLKPFFAPWS